jgi:hypothetical protein
MKSRAATPGFFHACCGGRFIGEGTRRQTRKSRKSGKIPKKMDFFTKKVVIDVKNSSYVGIPLHNSRQIWLSSTLLCLRGHASGPM